MTTATLTRVRRATPADTDTIAEILTRGFFNDPVMEWIVPDPADRGRYAYNFFKAFGGAAIPANLTFVDSNGGSAAIWLPVDPANPEPEDPELGAQIAEVVGPYIERFAEVDQIMQSLHPDHTAHAYLHFVSTVPERQGQGLGRAVIEAYLKELDAAGTPAYLEATTIQSARLYRRLGFEHLSFTIDLPDGPSMYPMWREPR
jgi:ribosomal protein S18 acetylase RimI-like enzyme